MTYFAFCFSAAVKKLLAVLFFECFPILADVYDVCPNTLWLDASSRPVFTMKARLRRILASAAADVPSMPHLYARFPPVVAASPHTGADFQVRSQHLFT